MAVWSKPQLKDIYSNRRIDSEYFDPAYIKTEDTMLQCDFDELGRLGHFVPGPFGSAFRVQNYDFKSSFRYIRGRDVKPFFLLDDDNRYIPENDFLRLAKYTVSAHDLFISVVGTLGNVSICTEENTPAIFSCKSTIFRAEKADPYYLLTYLNCSYGKICLLRRQRGAVQTGLNIEDLREIPVPRFSVEIENGISNLIKTSLCAARKARQYYIHAQQLLEAELGLNKLHFSKQVSYTTNLSNVLQKNRADADFYQIPFIQMHKYLDTLNTISLDSLCLIKKGIEVGSSAYNKKGKLFLRVSNITNIGIKFGESDKYISESAFKFFTPGFQPKPGELLLTKDGTPGVCFVVDERIDGIISGGIMRLILKKNDIPKEYLALIINSKICQMQVNQECSGAVILHWKPLSVKKLRIPILKRQKMMEIAELVIQSKRVSKESKQLLEQAKTRVEELIEKAVQK
jgi:restriction endonuclease S subunit